MNLAEAVFGRSIRKNVKLAVEVRGKTKQTVKSAVSKNNREKYYVKREVGSSRLLQKLAKREVINNINLVFFWRSSRKSVKL